MYKVEGDSEASDISPESAPPAFRTTTPRCVFSLRGRALQDETRPTQTSATLTRDSLHSDQSCRVHPIHRSAAYVLRDSPREGKARRIPRCRCPSKAFRWR